MDQCYKLFIYRPMLLTYGLMFKGLATMTLKKRIHWIIFLDVNGETST